MNEIYTFSATAKIKIEEMSENHMKTDKFQIESYNSSYLNNWYNCFSLHKSAFTRLNQDLNTMQPQTYHSFKIRDHLNINHSIYMSAEEKRLLIFSERNHNNDYALIEDLYETLFKSWDLKLQNYVNNMKTYIMAKHSLSGYYITLYHTLPANQPILSTTSNVNQTSLTKST